MIKYIYLGSISSTNSAVLVLFEVISLEAFFHLILYRSKFHNFAFTINAIFIIFYDVKHLEKTLYSPNFHILQFSSYVYTTVTYQAEIIVVFINVLRIFAKQSFLAFLVDFN